MAEAEIEAAAVRAGIDVLQPRMHHSRYDLVFDLGSRLLRVQCKWANRQGDVIAARIRTNRRAPEGYRTSTYTAQEVDAIGIYCPDVDRCYLLPMELAAGRTCIHLRLAPARNGQVAGLHSALEYEFDGAVAQLARAPAWHAGGREFESPQLHQSEATSSDVTEVGAHLFRNHFGYYMELAAAGSEIRVSRRGKPYVRLSPERPQLKAVG